MAGEPGTFLTLLLWTQLSISLWFGWKQVGKCFGERDRDPLESNCLEVGDDLGH